MKEAQKEKIAKQKEDFLKHLVGYRGNIHRSGLAIGIKWGHQWLRYHQEHDAEFAAKYEETKDEVNNRLLDGAEDLLYEKVFVKKETAAIIYLLKCKGKGRGWLEYKDSTGDGKPVVIKIERIVSDGKERVRVENSDALESKSNLQ
jgi:hypothetical protein